MKKSYFSTLRIAYLAVMTAFVMVVTYIVKIPMPYTNGYLNIGDSMVFLSGLMFDPIFGLIAGGVGSCLSDFAGGYAHWIVPTLIIKGLEGFACGGMFLLLKKAKINKHINVLLSMVIASIVMVVGYFVAGGIMGGFGNAVLSVGGNCIQAGASIIIAYLVMVAMIKVPKINNPLGLSSTDKGTKNDKDGKIESKKTDDADE